MVAVDVVVVVIIVVVGAAVVVGVDVEAVVAFVIMLRVTLEDVDFWIFSPMP